MHIRSPRCMIDIRYSVRTQRNKVVHQMRVGVGRWMIAYLSEFNGYITKNERELLSRSGQQTIPDPRVVCK